MIRILIAIALAIIAFVACTPTEAPPPEIQTIEVTRIVTETTITDVLQETEVTRIVEVPVEVTVPFYIVVTATQEPEPEPTDTPEAIAMTAADVLAALAADGLPVGGFVDYTAETDPNEMLGRPGGYTSKVNFHDTRLLIEYQDEFDTGDGGSIEVYPDERGATLRAEYLTSIIEAMPMLAEYHAQNSNVLLRISRRLTPEQVVPYEAAMENLKP